VCTAYNITWSVIRNVIKSFALGTDSYLVSQYVLRHVRVLASNTSLRPSYTNVGKVFPTTDALTLSEGTPTFLLDALPSGVWLKRTPSVDQVAPDKWSITQEYWHAETYNSFIYETAT
jgi:hypothetical protein